MVLEESDDYRLSIDGEFSVWRTRDKGITWKKLDNSLPDRAYLVVLSQATAMDNLDQAGIYMGTSTGQIFHSRDSGDTWELLADFFPPIYSINVSVI